MKKLLFILIVCALGATFVLKDREEFTKAVDLNEDEKAILLIEAVTGKVLYKENSTESLPIASMSKLMTQYLVLNAIENGSLSWVSTYEPTDYVQQMVGQSGVVKLGMSPGKVYTVKELFTAMTVVSANDAAIALAEMVSGTEDAFVEIMNEQAQLFGMKATTYFTASGLDGAYIGKGAGYANVSSAKDVAILAQKLIAKHPEVLEFTKITDFTTSDGERLWATNLMLVGMPQAVAGIDGLKTGYTDEAGSCFVSTGVFDGKRYISVVIGVQTDGTDTTNPRFNLTRELFERYVLGLMVTVP
ncbi:D-alanyl-D-alanine carboxypeptidase family protein [Sporosarcina sp. FA9]|uniref:D-alanyl-D-alanine carboxypeptidase family protein n=1 Tax=Sporosarcina sp. FA9 TaxID=3413030 RepID=UPI003F659328